MTEETQAPGVVFNIQKIYVKDASYEAPNVPAVFLDQQAAPQVELRMDVQYTALNEGEGIYEVVLEITATTQSGDKTLFLAEAQQAGLFQIKDVPPDDLPKVLQITCPSILLPFAREVMNDMVSKGGFPQFLMSPVNFEALYHQKEAGIKKRASQA